MYTNSHLCLYNVHKQSIVFVQRTQTVICVCIVDQHCIYVSMIICAAISLAYIFLQFINSIQNISILTSLEADYTSGNRATEDTQFVVITLQ